MNLQLNDVQQPLQDSLARLLGNTYDFEHRQRYVASEAGHAPEVWSQLAELGVMAAAVPQDQGGFGGDAVDHMLASEALGRHLSLEPYHGTVVMGATALSLAGSDGQKARLLPRVAEGTVQIAWAHDEAIAGGITVQAACGRDGWQLFGTKPAVLHGTTADYLLVTATTAGKGVDLFLVDARGSGVRREGYRLLDGTPAADIRLDGACAEPLKCPEDGLARILATGISAACAEMVGAMQATVTLTVDYLKTRKQFGKLIGANQALQHRAVDMLTALEQSRSLSLSLALALAGRNDLASGQAQVHAAKADIGPAARHVTQEAIQMHGGIGMTEEYAVGHYLRRVLVLDRLHGDIHYHTRRLEGWQD